MAASFGAARRSGEILVSRQRLDRGAKCSGRRHLLLLASLPLLSIWFPAAASGSESLQTILTKYVRAQRGINLRGKVVILTPTPGGTRTTTNRVVRTRSGESMAICEQPRSEAGTVTIERNGWLLQYSPRTRTLQKKRSLPVSTSPESVRRQVNLILRNYRVTVEGDEISAGRSCYRLRFVPRDPMGRTTTVWADKATGAELWRQESDREGNTLNVMFFTSVEFPAAIPQSALQPAIPPNAATVNISRAEMLRDVAALRKRVGFDVHLPLQLPPGYEFLCATVVEVGGQPMATLVFSDGMALLTVCEGRPTNGRPTGYRSLKVLPTPLGETMVIYGKEHLNLCVIGHLEKQALAVVAESIDPRRERLALQRMSRGDRRDLPQLARLRDLGMRADTLAGLVEIGRITRMPLPELVELRPEGGCWRDVARRVHVSEALVARQISALLAP